MIYRIYIETSVVSYFTSRPSNDMIKTGGLCAAKGHKLPELVTPFELMEVLP